MRTLAPVRWISLAWGALSACLAAAAFPADQPPLVGSHGHPASLVVRGATSIPAEAVKQALLNDTEVLLAQPGHKPEFDAWRWAKPAELLDLVVPFKRQVYAQVIRDFSPLAVPEG